MANKVAAGYLTVRAGQVASCGMGLNALHAVLSAAHAKAASAAVTEHLYGFAPGDVPAQITFSLPMTLCCSVARTIYL